MKKLAARLGVLVLAAVAFLGGAAAAQGEDGSLQVVTIPAQRIEGKAGAKVVFTARFLCTIPPQPLVPPPTPLAPGSYRTVFSIHNPNPVAVDFTEKAILTRRQGEPLAPVGQPVTETLGPDQGVELDCENIRDIAEVACIPEGCFLRGFVTITALREIDVVAIYTLKVP